MLRHFFFFMSVAVFAAAFGYAQQPNIDVSVAATQPNNGKQMYVNYCATCHGLDGRGHGPTTVALKVAPADLSALSRSNHGTYPALRVEAVLKFGVEAPAHGSQEMPVWGPVFRRIDNRGGGSANLDAMRIENLVGYVKALQAK